jgi:hypothetical protein
MPYRVEESQIVVGSDDAQAAQPAVGWEETMDRGLRQEVTFDFQGTAFSDAIAFLRKESGVNIIVDSAALRMIARGGDLPIHAKAEKIPVRDALHRILKPIPLNWQVLDEAVYVSQVEREAAAPELRFYSISDMGGWPEEFPGIRFTLRSDGGLRTPEQFITFLQESLPPVMKDKPLSLWPAWTRCAVVCPATVHEPIAAALRQVREFEMLQRLRPRLAQPVSLCLRNAPLERVLGFFRRVTGLNFAVPSPAPSEGLPGVTVEIFGAPAWEGLKYAALSCGLSCELTGSGIVIMRPAKVAGNVPAATGVLEIVPGSFGGFGFPVLP